MNNTSKDNNHHVWNLVQTQFIWKEETLEELLLIGLERERKKEEQSRQSFKYSVKKSEVHESGIGKIQKKKKKPDKIDFFIVDETNDVNVYQKGEKVMKLLGRPKYRIRRDHAQLEFELQLRKLSKKNECKKICGLNLEKKAIATRIIKRYRI